MNIRVILEQEELEKLIQNNYLEIENDNKLLEYNNIIIEIKKEEK